MADNQAGIMALPENQDVQGPTLGLDDTYDAVKQALGAARPDAAVEMDSAMAGLKGVADELTDEQLDSMMQLVQYLYDNKEQYKELVAELITAGIVEEGDLPAEYDPEFLSTFGAILLEERKSRGADQPPFPEKFARGGIAEAARIVANQGRSGDTMLAHITADEARMLRKMGGAGTINPATGLPEFGAFDFIVKPLQKLGSAVSKTFKSIVGGVKKVLASPVGRIVGTIALATFLGPGAMGITGLGLSSGVAAATAAGTISLASGENLKQAVKSAAFAYFVTPSAKAVGATATTAATPAFNNPVYDWIGKTTEQFAGANNFVADALQNQYVKTAVTGFGTGTAAGLLTGESLQDSVKGGLTGAAIATGVQALNNTSQAQAANAKLGANTVDEVAALNSNNVAAGGPFKDPSIPTALENADEVLMGGRAGNDPLRGPPAPTNTMQADAIRAANANLSPTDFVPKSAAGSTGSAYINDAGQFVSAADDVSGMPRIRNVSLYGSNAPGAGGSTSVAVDPASAGTYPGIGGSLKQIGGGIADIAQGNFKQGFDQLGTGAGNLFLPSDATRAQIENDPGFKASMARGASYDKAYELTAKSLNPSTFQTYAPAVAAGLGIAGLSGAFDAPEPPPSEQRTLLSGTPGEDKIAANPDQYVVQNIPGVSYSPEGQIVSSGRAPSSVSMQDVRVGPANYTASMQDVTRPTTPYGGSLMAPVQPQAPLMDPYQYYYQQYLASQNQPRYYAMGGITDIAAPMQAPPPPAGIASLRDGGNSNYPRRTGQIAGPGTEKSDSIPAMLSDGEFVMTAAAVRGMGKGSRREGAKRMYALMHQLEKNAARG
jgi:hypothetical protein